MSRWWTRTETIGGGCVAVAAAAARAGGGRTPRRNSGGGPPQGAIENRGATGAVVIASFRV